MRLIAPLGIIVLLAGGSTAGAQTRPVDPRGFVSVDGGYQGTAADFRDSVAFELHAEEGQFDASYDVEPAPVIDVRTGFRLWRRLGAGVGMTRYNRQSAAGIEARLPHPFFFDRPRSIAGSGAELTREELGVHVQAIWMVSAGDRVTVAVFGGPSFFTVTQDLVQKVRFRESYPFDSAEFTGIRKQTRRERATGFNAGLDLGFFFSRHLGVGAVLRFSRASVNFSRADQDQISIDAGGLQGGGGLRLRF